MKIRTCEYNEENVIQFKNFKDMSSEYSYRYQIQEELRKKKWYLPIGQKLTESEENSLLYSEGYCRGYIEAVHKTMSKLSIHTKEVQIQALENMKNAVTEDIDSELRKLKSQLEDNYEWRKLNEPKK